MLLDGCTLRMFPDRAPGEVRVGDTVLVASNPWPGWTMPAGPVETVAAYGWAGYGYLLGLDSRRGLARIATSEHPRGVTVLSRDLFPAVAR